jgi:serine---pyruvate transaminase
VGRFLRADADRAQQGNRRPVSFLCFQQNETSAAVAYHEEAIRDLVREARAHNPEIIIIADAISGALAHHLEFDELDLDILFLGSQKALGVSPGLAYAVLSDRAVRVMLELAGYKGSLEGLSDDSSCDAQLATFGARQRVHSISLLRALVAERRQQIVDVPSLFHLLSTRRALELFDQQGGRQAVIERHAALARLVRERAQDLGLTLMAKPPFASDSVTAVVLPPGIHAGALRRALARETGVAVAGAQGDVWKDSMIRIGTLGFVTRGDVVRCMRGLQTALENLGAAAPREIGAGLNSSEAGLSGA